MAGVRDDIADVRIGVLVRTILPDRGGELEGRPRGGEYF